ncbi:MAG: hypothetical protein UU18_C0011G0009 [Parcubacteria group bacterium GW2011_GWB2_40_8]|nr:MAG: hypothetical protein UT71_C0002G0026 [Parcubacteria group bacterium GW2011_GWF2_40_10]KKR47803.1 MAG: hypothetical protein UT83_C0003G0016 [Parcubacteria group bacterium GW2011_GWA2_40_143]KKR60234.1 MAG: hypothetical protein UT97_C0003G0016 [Parcubacteria group bacterium GW2011_GWC2_40_31]KKR75204.1 MAG: hypothetical protein UU18_C0011G0009 [Parcubacteria group bacterium GW2011_GWB2_40_8]KKR77319.1 MAG: hypothetical protein UU20_C0010G0009 [Parcubacteria group bacterium GW2011_GWE2_40_
MSKAIPLGGNLVCSGVKNAYFNLSLMGERYAEDIFCEENTRESKNLEGFYLKSGSRGRLVVMCEGKGKICDILAHDKFLKVAFLSTFRRKAREELSCKDCAHKCMIVNVLKAVS